MIELIFTVLMFCFSSRRRHTRFDCDWSSDVCSSDLMEAVRDEIAGLVEKVGKAGDIDRLHIQAQTDRDTAAREYEQSKERAKQAMDEVDKAAKARQAEYDKSRAVAEADLAKRLAEVNDHSKRNAEQWVKIAEADDAIRKADKAKADYDQAKVDVNKLKAVYETKLAAIKAAAGE